MADIFKSPFNKIGFFITWATDQIESLFIPLYDLLYTFCYYYCVITQESFKVVDYGILRHIHSGLILTYLFIRFLQCLKKSKIRGQKRKYIFYSFKYIVLAASCILCYYQKREKFFELWVFFLCLATIFEIFWDMKIDWGLLQGSKKHPLLRHQLYYHNPRFYYWCIFLNIFLRFNYVITIQPHFPHFFYGNQNLLVIIGMLELVRRFIWNTLKLERRCMDFEYDFITFDGLSLPFKVEINSRDKKLKKFVEGFMEKQFQNIKVDLEEFLAKEEFEMGNIRDLY